MRFTSALALLLAAGTVGAPAPVAAQASPSAVVLRDGPGGVWAFSDSGSGYQPAVQPEADVLRARVTHGRYAVSVRLTFDDLRRTHTQWYYCDLHTAGATARFILEALDGRWRGALFQDVEGEWVRVPGTSHRIDYASDVVTMRFARRLVGESPWVRVRLRNELGLGDGVFVTDNPTTDEPVAAYTPRIPVAAVTAGGSSGR
ncbi:hypothetical protein [Nocardioides halotolerans]|uniref:hypothetical protein n=1 Tax=Nocardioides halotolerans TaxID=433660 RepID=UPI00040E2677|nr:hypothetical protein [Nocardioides halotolerans]